jgi:serine/threonine protein kinase/Tfp pilus assembly protein PilF
MGIVYKAEDTRLKRTVALKFLPPELTRDPEAKERFIHEAQAASALDHPNICTIHELGETEEGQVFIVMACYDGETLRQKIQRGPLPAADAVEVAIQVASGLSEAHRSGIIHRDIKPENIIVTPARSARIIDFGLAKLTGQARLTRTGSTVGTVAYMSPEQARGEEVDARTDIWSLGAVLYEMLSGNPPFAAEHEQAVLYRILNEEPDALTICSQDIPAGIVRTVQRALRKDTVERYSSALEMLQELKLAAHGGEAAPRSPKSPASVAVLPFEDLSPEKNQEYFCDGVAEELINALTHVTGLRVIARTSSFSFKGQRTDVREIGRKLGVETLLEGSVRRADQRLRITVQLTSSREGSPIWSERYDHDLKDIFAIQDSVCAAVVEHLKVTLGHSERSNMMKRRANDHEAYTLYLKGRFFFNQRKHESVAKSIEYYSQAVAVDPGFALAFAGLAESYEVLGSWGDVPRESAFNEARKASATALRLDDRLPEAHVTAGYVSLFCDWNWAAAEREFQRALTLNPSCTEAHHMRAHYLELMGKFETAIAEIQQAMELEPVAPGLGSCAAQILFNARQYEEAIRQAYATLEIAPTFYGLHGWVGAAYVKSGQLDSGFAALKKGLEHLPEDPRLLSLFGTACAISHKADQAHTSLERLRALSRGKYVDPYYLAWLHEALGNRAAACESLEKAFHERSGWVPWMSVDPLLEDLRTDPRVQELLERLGLRSHQANSQIAGNQAGIDGVSLPHGKDETRNRTACTSGDEPL